MSSWAERFWTLVLVVALAGGTIGAVDAAESARGSAAAAKPSPKMRLGREARREEIAAWDTDVRPDGAGRPAGRGTVKQGERSSLMLRHCHGGFGQGVGRLSRLPAAAARWQIVRKNHRLILA